MIRDVFVLIVSLFIGLLAINGVMYAQQSSMIFFPSAHLEQTPRSWGLNYEDVKLKTSDGIHLHGWYIPHNNSDRVLLFFHGNAGNISHRGHSVQIFHRLGLNVLLIDYRGYGRSEGEPDESGLYKDAEAAWRYLVDQRGLGSDKIILFGRSLGGSVAIHLTAKIDPAGLIVESSFSSVRDMAKNLFPILSKILILGLRFDSLNLISQVHCPVLFLHSPDDEIIPFALGQKLYQGANEPKHFVRLKGDHNSGFLISQPDYEKGLSAFIDAVFTQAEPFE